ncbi:MAG: hypothetical protein IJZ27_01740 [Treponema sp.]|nr:hypothetical protein [Treponema sp.]
MSENKIQESQLLILKEAYNLEITIKSNPLISNPSELLFSVAKIKEIAKSQLEVLNRAYDCIKCDFSDNRNEFKKKHLYSALNEITPQVQSKTVKQQRQLLQQSLLKETKNLEKLIKSNHVIQDDSEINDSLSKLNYFSRVHSEFLRRSEVVCFCARTEEKDSLFKHLLSKSINQILENLV